MWKTARESLTVVAFLTKKVKSLIISLREGIELSSS